jgi:hypothetical protein
VLGVAILGAYGTAVSLGVIGVLLLLGAVTVGISIGRPAKV